MDVQDFGEILGQSAKVVEVELDSLLSQTPSQGELVRPPLLVEAMRHGVLQGGKRLRPFLVFQSAALFGVGQEQAMRLACALECLHCYSLIHDDLPAMDDDDLRRGQPTVHRAYDEATAILAGDALLSFSFDLITGEACHGDGNIRSKLANMLARASGQGGMIGGQVLDLQAEKQILSESDIRTLQAMKTGALIRFACEGGAVLGNATPQHQECLSQYGKLIGLAFQLADDLLDVTSNAEEMGKAVGKDEAQGKGTLVGLYGVEKARVMLDELVTQSKQALKPFGSKAEILVQTAKFIAERKS